MNANGVLGVVAVVIMLGFGVMIYGSTEYTSETGTAVVTNKPIEKNWHINGNHLIVRWKGELVIVRCNREQWHTTKIDDTVQVEQRCRHLWDTEVGLRVKED